MIRFTAKPVVSGMSSRHNQKIQSEEATIPTSLDVLCGSGHERAIHPGNMLFSLTVSKYVEQYVLAEFKKDKMRVSKAAFDELTISGVRFLKIHRIHRHWYVAGQKVGRDRIGSFLREHLPKAISGSENDRRRQRPAGTFHPLPPVHSSTAPLANFLVRERASSHGHAEIISSVWSKLDDLQDGPTLAKVGRARTNQPTELTPSFQPPECFHGNDTIYVRSPTAFFPKDTLMPLFGPSASNRMESSTPLSLQREPPDNNKKVLTYQRCRQETPLSFLTEEEAHACVPVKYPSTSLDPSILGLFSSVLSSEADLISSSMYGHDYSDSDLSRDDLFDAFELAQCLDW